MIAGEPSQAEAKLESTLKEKLAKESSTTAASEEPTTILDPYLELYPALSYHGISYQSAAVESDPISSFKKQEIARLESLLSRSEAKIKELEEEVDVQIEVGEARDAEIDKLTRRAQQREREHYEAMLEAREAEVTRVSKAVDEGIAIGLDAGIKNSDDRERRLQEEHEEARASLNRDYEARLARAKRDWERDRMDLESARQKRDKDKAKLKHRQAICEA